MQMYYSGGGGGGERALQENMVERMGKGVKVVSDSCLMVMVVNR